jgi:hypothetical protein
MFFQILQGDHPWSPRSCAMKKQQRYFLILELLDERIVPSGVGGAPIHHAALAEHSAIHAAVHVTKVHPAVHPKIPHHTRVHLARVHHKHQNRIVPALQISGTSAFSRSTAVIGTTSAATVAIPTASAIPTPVVSATGIGPAQVPAVATPLVATSIASTSTTARAPVPNPAATSNPADIQNGPLAKAGQDLITIYEEFVQQGGSATFTSSEAGRVRIVGTSVGVEIHSAGGNFGNLVSAMTGLGMQVQAKDATYGIIEGLLPIGQLVAAAQNSQTVSLSPIYLRMPRSL